MLSVPELSVRVSLTVNGPVEVKTVLAPPLISRFLYVQVENMSGEPELAVKVMVDPAIPSGARVTRSRLCNLSIPALVKLVIARPKPARSRVFPARMVAVETVMESISVQ